MKTKLSGASVLLLAGLAVLAQPRTLLLKSGATVEGEIVAIGPDAATIKRASDGKVYSLPLMYLSESNRQELAAARASQWQPIEVIRLEGTASAGRYRRCLVRGTNVNDIILVQMMPESVEAILKNRNAQANQIAALSGRIESRDWAVQRADAITPTTATGDPDYVNAVLAQRAQVNLAIVDLNQAKTNLARLEQSYADYLDQTRADTIVQMKKTALTYEGLQVWECFDPRKPQ